MGLGLCRRVVRSSGWCQRIDWATGAMHMTAIRMYAARHERAVAMTVAAGALRPREVVSVFRMTFILTR